MKVSVVITVKNKAEPIEPLIKALQQQSKKPDEIIVQAGGNRSQGRNAGIKAANNEIIAVTDSGCVPHRDWLEKLTAPFSDKNVKSAAGFYRPVTKTIFTKCAAPFVAVMPDKFNPETYLPSSRSVAFRRGTAWYPENLNYCEDLVFAQRLAAAGKMVRAEDALVNWQLPGNFWQLLRQIFNYARGDVKARYRPHVIKIITVWLRYVIFILFWPLFPVYLVWPIVKLGRYTPAPGWLILPLMQTVVDFGVMAGSASAIISKRYDTLV